MNTQASRTYDLPLRLFHWIFALLFLSSFTIAKVVDDESVLFTYHMLSGIMMGFLIILRLVWGIVGPKYSRFSSFKLAPSELCNYLLSIINSKSRRYLGHNPASSYASIIMFILTAGLIASGVFMSQRFNKHFFEEIHELFANGFIVIVILHISGVLFHQIKHQDGMLSSMITGKKETIDGESEIISNRPLVGLFFIFLLLIFGLYLKNSYSIQTGQLNMFGKTIQLGEKEERE